MGRLDSGGWSGNAIWIVLAALLAGGAYYFFVRPRLATRTALATPALVSIPCRNACARTRDVCLRDQAETGGSGRASAECAARFDDCSRRCGSP